MLAALLGIAPPVAAQTPAPPAAAPATPAPAAAEQRPAKLGTLALATRSGFSDLDLSPDGSLLAFRASIDGQRNLAVFETESQKMLHKLVLPEKNELDWYRWAGNGKLLLALSTQTMWFGEEARISRLYAYDLSTRALDLIGKKEMGLEGDDLLYVDPAGQYVLLSMQRTIYDYPSVWNFPLDGTGGKTGRKVQDERTGVWEWFADNTGVVRIGYQYTEAGKLKILYRPNAQEKFREIAKLTEDNFDDQIWEVERIVSGSDEGLVRAPDENGLMTVRKFNYATRTPGEVVYAVPGWDVTDAAVDDNNQLIAAFYTDERDRVEWFEPKMKAAQSRLEKALKTKEVWVVSRAKDYSRMIVWAGGEDNPGGYFIYSAAKRTLVPFVTEFPQVDRALLATPRPIAYTARDGTTIRGYLTLPRGRAAKGLPLIILPHGGPFFVRDRLDYSSEVQFLANRGYAVIQPNFRGSEGFGEKFAELGRGQIGRNMQDDLDDAMDWAVKEGIADPARVCMVGSSYGGYAALWAVIRNPERYRCAASFAGVTDWNRQLRYNASFLTRKGAKKWRAQVTGDDAKFNLDLVSPVHQVARLTRPVLLAHGDDDNTVPYRQFRVMKDAAEKARKPIDLLTFTGEGHGFDQAANEAKWYDALDAFLTKHNPAD